MTSVTPWIARVDLADLVGYAGFPPSFTVPCVSLLKLQSSMEEDNLL